MCIYTCVSMGACTCACTCICTDVRRHVSLRVFGHDYHAYVKWGVIRVDVCVHIQACAWACVCMFLPDAFAPSLTPQTSRPLSRHFPLSLLLPSAPILFFSSPG